MSGEDIPYQLRPNKFIDRSLFVDVLNRLVIPRGPEKYIYVSMGGRHLVDHYAVYHEIGISAQFAFDRDANAVARQKFNRPTDATICEMMNSSDLPTSVDRIFGMFKAKKNLIVWLDYTSGDWAKQLQESIETLVKLKHGDVFRITMVADRRLLKVDKWKENGAAGPEEYRGTLLRKELGDAMPTNITKIDRDELPSVLARCFELACSKAQDREPQLRFVPVLATTYADGMRMVSITCVIKDANHNDPCPPEKFHKWRYACKSWTDIHEITAPILSSKERHKLDARLTQGPKKMLAALKFLPYEDQETSLAALRSYKAFHRYYPTFRNVDD